MFIVPTEEFDRVASTYKGREVEIRTLDGISVLEIEPNMRIQWGDFPYCGPGWTTPETGEDIFSDQTVKYPSEPDVISQNLAFLSRLPKTASDFKTLVVVLGTMTHLNKNQIRDTFKVVGEPAKEIKDAFVKAGRGLKPEWLKIRQNPEYIATDAMANAYLQMAEVLKKLNYALDLQDKQAATFVQQKSYKTGQLLPGLGGGPLN